MTREEAINQFQDAKDGYKEYLTDEALDMAIRALEQEPCEESVADDKPHIKGDYFDGFKNGLRTAKWRYDKIRAEIIELRSRQNVGVLECLDIIDKYKDESERKDG